MARISGVNLPEGKKIKIALQSIYGLGKKNAILILNQAQVDAEKRTKDLNDQEMVRLQKAVESVSIEGALRKVVMENIKRLKQTNTYRGLRHAANLPVRGQRTRCNARTKRGKRVTIGAMKKDLAQKLESTRQTKGKETEEK